MRQKILVIDDDADLCASLAGALRTSGYDVDWTTSAPEGTELVATRPYATAFVDIELGRGASGLELCRQIVGARPDLPVVILTGHDDLDNAVAAIRAGAFDFVKKPVSLATIGEVVARAIEQQRKNEPMRIAHDGCPAGTPPGMIGSSPAMQKVFDQIAQVSRSDANVLITGESGTGKELVSRAIHALSERAEAPFVAVNCAAMPSELLESELFGHASGAFTSAAKRRRGLFVAASGGTILLDEIAEMSLEMQAKLLRVLQNHLVRAVGDDEEVPVDFRLITATNHDLEANVRSGGFREDLFYRIDVVRVEVPPLRERGDDILLLAETLLERAQNGDARVFELDDGAQRKLLDYDWPGNVRELENVIARAMALCKGWVIRPEDLPREVRRSQGRRVLVEGRDPDKMPSIDEIELRYIHHVLAAVDGNKTQASRILGMNRRTLYRKLARFADAH